MTYQQPNGSGRPFSHFVEDGGLAALMGTQNATLARDAALGDTEVLQAVREVLKVVFADEQRKRFLDPFASPTERNAEVVTVLRAAIAEHTGRGGILRRVPADDETLLALYAATFGWGPAQKYVDDPRVNEIKIVGVDISVQEAGKPFVTVPERFTSTDEVLSRVLLLSQVLRVRLDAETPQATLPVGPGTRMHASIPPRVVDGVLVCIRRGRTATWDLNDVLARGTMDENVAELLRLLSRARCSMLIAGQTGSGKTGLLEAIANSWVGGPHILTIEDHTREIGIRRPALWTAEMVDTQRDPLAFGRVAREALRQTPGLLLPGEIRGNEAGAILMMALTDHPTLSTLHARSCEEAIERFASCAALPGAYMWEGRRPDALRDACAAFDVLINVDNWEEAGLRVITEIALLGGCVVEGGIVRPQTIPLVQVEVEQGVISWRGAARVVEGGMLEWVDGVDRTPPMLREKLKRARALAQIRAASTTLDVVAEALARAEQRLLASEPERALATLKSAWGQRRDPRLLGVAQRAIQQAPLKFTEILSAAAGQMAVLERCIQVREWAQARTAYEQLLEDLGISAAAMPSGGWDPLNERIKQGIAQEQDAEAATIEARTALAQGHPNAAVDLLRRFVVTDLPVQVAVPLLKVREAAMRRLLENGEGSAAALETVRQQRIALESSLGVPALAEAPAA